MEPSGNNDSELWDFLEHRGISEDVLRRMKEEKIDETIIPLMEEASLKELFPKYGDLIAIRDYCKRLSFKPTSKKQSVLENLRKHFQKVQKQPTKKTKYNSEKDTRMIDIGWKNVENERPILVQDKKGGGTRRIPAPKIWRKADIMKKAIELFFPNNKSSKGLAEHFEIDLVNSRDISIDNELTISGILEETKMKQLKFYLLTKKTYETDDEETAFSNSNEKEEIEEQGVALYPPQSTLPIYVYVNNNQDMVDHNTLFIESVLTNSVDDQTPECSNKYVIDTNTSDVVVTTSKRSRYNLSSSESEDDTSSQKGIFFDEAISLETPNDQETINDSGIDQPILKNENVTVKIKRQTLLDDVMAVYETTEGLEEKNITVTFDGEMGIDSGGLTREMFALFWNLAEDKFFIGEDVIIPFLPLQRRRKEMDLYKILGKILAHNYLITGNFPKKFPLSVLMRIFNMEHAVEKCIILNDFLKLITLRERKLLVKALKHFSNLSEKENNDLINIFISYDFNELPKGEDISEQIHAIASDIVELKPLPYIRKLNEGLGHHKLYFKSLTLETIRDIINRDKPNRNKVANVIKGREWPTAEEQKIMNYVENYIHSMNPTELEDFIFFVTGSCHMPDEINVDFFCAVGEAMAPKSSTCSKTLRLPKKFDSYWAFKRNMDAFLKCEFSYSFSNI